MDSKTEPLSTEREFTGRLVSRVEVLVDQLTANLDEVGDLLDEWRVRIGQPTRAEVAAMQVPLPHGTGPKDAAQASAEPQPSARS